MQSQQPKAQRKKDEKKSSERQANLSNSQPRDRFTFPATSPFFTILHSGDLTTDSITHYTNRQWDEVARYVVSIQKAPHWHGSVVMERYLGSAERPDLSREPNTLDNRPHATRHEIRNDAEGMNRDKGIDVSTDASMKVRLTQ